LRNRNPNCSLLSTLLFSLASREKLDNLIFVINCNLQRLDGPVRGNGQIIQELEANFRGSGWNVIKVIWGSEWDALLDKDRDGLLVKRMGEVVDGEYQKYAVESGSYVRSHFWGADPRLLEMVAHLSDDQLKKLTLGGHDPIKVYAAYKSAVEHTGQPTVILARTIKGYGIGEAGEGKNITHQQKKMNEADLRHFRDRFGIPISDDQIADAPFFRPDESSVEMRYMRERRAARPSASVFRFHFCYYHRRVWIDRRGRHHFHIPVISFPEHSHFQKMSLCLWGIPGTGTQFYTGNSGIN